MSNFDYGERKPDGQYQRYPSSVILDDNGNPKYIQPIRNSYKHLKCGAVTTMRGDDLCLTYATNNHFYGSTFCCGCGEHLPLNEFVWLPDGTPMNEIRGTPGLDLRV